jgi:hypothetical protein
MGMGTKPHEALINGAAGLMPITLSAPNYT